MADKKPRRVDWSRDEFILALDLYQRKGLLDDHHPDVVELSELLRNMSPEEVDANPNYRNANGIALRLANFASVDPAYHGKGMASLSKLGHEIWEEFANDTNKLRDASRTIRSKVKQLDFNEMLNLMQTPEVREAAASFEPTELTDERKRVAAEIVRRQGQSSFRNKLLTAYSRKCAVTLCDAEPALEAAHILGYSGNRSNHVTNGLLLRADVHILFDLGLIAIEPAAYCIVIAPNIQQTCYAEMSGKAIVVPEDPDARPSRKALELHFESSHCRKQ